MKFQGVFGYKLPDDVGGAGRYSRVGTRMGALLGYVERFRGTDDQAGVIEARMKAVDEFVDLILGWARQEYGKQAEFGKLGKFLDKDLRTDLKNASLLMWTIGWDKARIINSGLPERYPAQKDSHIEFIARLSLYLAEREYFLPEEFPMLVHLFGPSGERVGRQAAEQFLRQLLARKVALSDKAFVDGLSSMPVEGSLAARSFEAYVRATPGFQAALAKWKRAAATQPDLAAPNSWAHAMGVLDPAMASYPDNTGSDDEVRLCLKTATRPVETNGRYDESGEVAWDVRVPTGAGAGTSVPVVCYALWTQPDEGFQVAHFGRVVLDGEELAEYILWHEGVSLEQARLWDGFLETLRPGKDLRDKLKAFRFPARPSTQPTQPGEDHPTSGAHLILQGLGEAR